MPKGISSFVLNSETERFELSVQVTPHNTLAGCRLKPTRPRFLSDIIYNNTNILFFKILFILKKIADKISAILITLSHSYLTFKSRYFTACSFTCTPVSAFTATAFEIAMARRFFAPLNINSTPLNVLLDGVKIFFNIS